MSKYYNLNVLEIYFIFNYCIPLWVYVCAFECRSPQRPDEGVGFLELKFQTVVSHPVWSLGRKFRYMLLSNETSLQHPMCLMYKYCSYMNKIFSHTHEILPDEIIWHLSFASSVEKGRDRRELATGWRFLNQNCGNVGIHLSVWNISYWKFKLSNKDNISWFCLLCNLPNITLLWVLR